MKSTIENRNIDLIIGIFDTTEKFMKDNCERLKAHCTKYNIPFVQTSANSQDSLKSEINNILSSPQYKNCQTPLIQINCHGNITDTQEHEFTLSSGNRVKTSNFLNSVNKIAIITDREACVFIGSCYPGTLFSESINLSNIAVLPENTTKTVTYDNDLKEITAQGGYITLSGIQKNVESRSDGLRAVLDAKLEILNKNSLVKIKGDHLQFIRKMERMKDLMNSTKEVRAAFLQDVFGDEFKQFDPTKCEEIRQQARDWGATALSQDEKNQLIFSQILDQDSNFLSTILQNKNPLKNVQDAQNSLDHHLFGVNRTKRDHQDYGLNKFVYSKIEDYIQRFNQDGKVFQKFSELPQDQLELIRKNAHAEKMLEIYEDDPTLTQKYPITLIRPDPYRKQESLRDKIKKLKADNVNGKNDVEIKELEAKIITDKTILQAEYEKWHTEYLKLSKANKENYNKIKAEILKNHPLPDIKTELDAELNNVLQDILNFVKKNNKINWFPEFESRLEYLKDVYKAYENSQTIIDNFKSEYLNNEQSEIKKAQNNIYDIYEDHREISELTLLLSPFQKSMARFQEDYAVLDSINMQSRIRDCMKKYNQNPEKQIQELNKIFFYYLVDNREYPIIYNKLPAAYLDAIENSSIKAEDKEALQKTAHQMSTDVLDSAKLTQYSEFCTSPTYASLINANDQIASIFAEEGYTDTYYKTEENLKKFALEVIEYPYTQSELFTCWKYIATEDITKIINTISDQKPEITSTLVDNLEKLQQDIIDPHCSSAHSALKDFWLQQFFRTDKTQEEIKVLADCKEFENIVTQHLESPANMEAFAQKLTENKYNMNSFRGFLNKKHLDALVDKLVEKNEINEVVLHALDALGNLSKGIFCGKYFENEESRNNFVTAFTKCKFDPKQLAALFHTMNYEHCETIITSIHSKLKVVNEVALHNLNAIKDTIRNRYNIFSEVRTLFSELLEKEPVKQELSEIGAVFQKFNIQESNAIMDQKNCLIPKVEILGNDINNLKT